jgi:hypothetical protein
LPKDIPVAANEIYKDDGWTTWGDWLGTGNIAKYLIVYRPFSEARTFVRSLRLKGARDWRIYCKNLLAHSAGKFPDDLPKNPDKTYAEKGWAGWGDWLGTGTVAPYLVVYRDFESARDFARSLKLRSTDEWQSFCRGELPHLGKLPEDISASPRKTYLNKGWVSMGDWLGTGNIAQTLKPLRPFVEAREFARSLKLVGKVEWDKFCKGGMPEKGELPSDIPMSVYRAYKNHGWVSMADWLGAGRRPMPKKRYRDFVSARTFVQSLKLKNRSEWITYANGERPEIGDFPADLPAAPAHAYASSGWIGWSDWLGNGVAPKKRNKT